MNDKIRQTELINAMAVAIPEEGVKLLAGLGAKDAFNLILEHPHPDQITALMPIEQLYLLMHEITPDDALVLLELVNPEQVQGFLDIDCWNRDRIDLVKARTWFIFLNELDEDALLNHLREMDLALLVTFFGAHVQIHKLEDRNDEFQVEGITYITPDGRHLIEYTCTMEISRLINTLLYKVSQMDLEFFQKLVEAIYWEYGVEVEEAAFLDRNNRMDSRGFPDYYAALELMTTVDLERFTPTKKIVSSAKATQPGAVLSSSQYLTKYDHPETLLRRALAEPFDGREEISIELMTLTNMAAIASQVPFYELDQVRKLVARTDGYISIGLEHLVGDDLLRAREMLQTYRCLDLHKIGRTLVMTQARHARKILRTITLNADDPHPNRLLLDGPEGEIFYNLLHPEPADFTTGKNELWTRLEQVKQIERLLNTLQTFTTLMQKDFGFTPKTIRNLPLTGSNIPEAAELTYRILFNTFRCQDLLGRTPSATPISLTDLSSLSKMISHVKGKPSFQKASVRQLDEWLKARLTEESTEAIRMILHRYLDALAMELANHQMDSRFRRELLIRLD